MSEELKTVERLKAKLLGEIHLMTPVDLQAYWSQVKWPKPNLVDLAKAGSPLGFALRALRLSPQQLAEISGHLDPFGFLLGGIDMAEWGSGCRTHQVPWMTRVWLAAASQLRAERRLVHKAHGWADTWEQLRQNRDKPDFLRFADDFYLEELRHANETRRAELLGIPGLEERLTRARQDKDEAFLRRFRRARSGGGAVGVSSAESYAVQHWLELPSGLPGLCFFSDVALDAFLSALGLSTGDNGATKQLRVRRGLVQAGAKRHLIEEVVDLKTEIRFTGSMVTEPWIFKGKISWGQRNLWPEHGGQIPSHIEGDS